MAVTRDQTATGQALAGVTTFTVTWPTRPAPGSTALISVVDTSTDFALSGAVDNGVIQSTFTADVSIAPGAHAGKWILRANNITLPASGSYQVTVTMAGSCALVTTSGATYLGVLPGAPAGTNSNAATGSAVTTGNVTPAAAGSLIFGGMDTGSSLNPETITLTTSGATSLYTQANGASFLVGAVADNIATSTAAQGLAWTLGDSVSWGGWAAVYSPAPTAPGVSLVPPGPFTPMAFRTRAVPSTAPPEVTAADTGTGADTTTVTASISSADTGSGADTGSRGAIDSDSGSGADTGSVTSASLSGTETGSGADTGTVTAGVSSAETGSAAESASGDPAVITSDTGTGADAGAVIVPVTGSGITWQLNPVRESMTGLDVTRYLSQALGAVLQFANHGSERLYVLSSDPGVTLTVLTGGTVLDQEAQPFPAVTLAPSTLYCFGPFHTVVQVPGTSVVQVALSTAFGVQVAVVQGPDAH